MAFATRVSTILSFASPPAQLVPRLEARLRAVFIRPCRSRGVQDGVGTWETWGAGTAQMAERHLHSLARWEHEKDWGDSGEHELHWWDRQHYRW